LFRAYPLAARRGKRIIMSSGDAGTVARISST
jgi:hypothetical protein